MSDPSKYLNDAQFRAQTLSPSEGASRRASDLAVPQSGFAVGGASNASGQRFPEQRVRSAAFSEGMVSSHLAQVRKHFGHANETVHQGSWQSDGNVVLDASDVYQRKGQALVEGYKRGEDAIYDINKGTERRLGKKVHK